MNIDRITDVATEHARGMRDGFAGAPHSYGYGWAYDAGYVRGRGAWQAAAAKSADIAIACCTSAADLGLSGPESHWAFDAARQTIIAEFGPGIAVAVELRMRGAT